MEVTNLIPNQWYCVTVSEACTITAKDGTGFTQTLKECSKAGQYMVKTISDKLNIDDDHHALVEGPFKVAPAGGLGGGEFDGHLNGNLYVGNGDEPAVAAVCTLTLGNLTTGGTLADSNGQSVELEAPHKYATGTVSISDATAAGTLTIDDWSKEWEAKTDAKASGTFATMAADGEVITVTNGGVDYPVSVPAYPDYESVDGWNAAFTAAGCGIVCTAVEAIGEVVVSVEAAETGEAGNSIVISVENYEPVTLAGGSTARTAVDVFNDIHNDADCPVGVSLDADELGLGFTAKEYGVNDTISAEGDMFSNWSGMSGGHGDYTVAELVTAIADEFDDITPAAGETEGTITLTANVAGAAANSITYTATGCFGGGTVKQGSTTRGKNAVEQTAFKIYLNGEEFTGGSVTIDPTPTQGSTNAVSSGGVYAALEGKQASLTAGDGIALTGGTIAVDSSGTVASGDTLPVSGETVAAALGDYLPLSALAAATLVTGNWTFAGNIVFSNTSGINVKGHNYGFVDDGNWYNAPSGFYIWGNNYPSNRPHQISIGLSLTARTGLNVTEILTTENNDEGSRCVGLVQPSIRANGITRDNAIIYHRCTKSGSVYTYHEIDFGMGEYPVRLKGASVSLVVKSNTAGVDDTVLTLDAVKLQKLIDFIETL